MAANIMTPFPLANGSTWELPEHKLKEWQSTHPQLDVLREITLARQWLLDNPKRRKTARGMTRFLGGWLSGAKIEERSASGISDKGGNEWVRVGLSAYLNGAGYGGLLGYASKEEIDGAVLSIGKANGSREFNEAVQLVGSRLMLKYGARGV